LDSNFAEQLLGVTLENSFGEPLWVTGLKYSSFGATILRRCFGKQLRELLWGAGLRSRFGPLVRSYKSLENTIFRDFPTFSRICMFFLLIFSLLLFSFLIFLFSLPLSCIVFHLSILSEVWLLNVLRYKHLFVYFLWLRLSARPALTS